MFLSIMILLVAGYFFHYLSIVPLQYSQRFIVSRYLLHFLVNLSTLTFIYKYFQDFVGEIFKKDQ